MTDTLTFTIIDPIANKEQWAFDFIEYDSTPILSVGIYINGKEMIDILKEIEIPFAESEHHPNLAGAYGHRKIQHLYDDLNSNMHCTEWGVDLVLCNGCGLEGCWTVSVLISEDDQYVYWSNFRHNHRKNWQYPISYKFTKENYYSQLQTLKSFLS